jgi:hypothetical protein
MNRTWSLLLSAFLFIAADKPEGVKRKTYSRLQVKMKWNRDFYLDSIAISASGSIHNIANKYSYDKETGISIYTYDSVPNGAIDIRFVSLMDRIYSRPLMLEKDTLITIADDELPAFTKADSLDFPFENLPDGKEIMIYVVFPNMFYTAQQKTTIRKTGNTFEVRFNSARSSYTSQGKRDIERIPEVHKQLDASFSNPLTTFKQECIKLYKGKHHFSYCFHGDFFYFVYENKIFRLHNPCTKWDGYNAFLNKIPVKEWKDDQ